MRIQNPKRTILIGLIVWLLFFGWWFRGYLFRNWRFRLFSFDSWRHLMREFRSGWYISTKSDWIFIVSFILAPVIFGLLWYFAQKVEWRKLWKKIWRAIRWPFLANKKKKLEEQTSIYTPREPIATPVYKPRSMPATGGRLQPTMQTTTFLNNSTAMGNFSSEVSREPVRDFSGFDVFSQKRPFPEETSAPAKTFSNEEFAQMAETPISEIEIPKMEPAKENIPELLEKAGYTLLTDWEVMGQKVDILAVSDSNLLVILFDKQPGDWLADEESFNDEDPLWFSETDHRVSPVFLLKTLKAQLQKKLGEITTVRPVLIEQEGTIINAEDMMKTWNDLEILVCRTGMGGPVELPTGTEILSEPQEKITPDALEKIKSML